MINTSAQLKRRVGALAPADILKRYIFLKSRDYKDAAERKVAAVDLEKDQGNIVILQNTVDGGDPGDPPGTIRTLWKR